MIISEKEQERRKRKEKKAKEQKEKWKQRFWGIRVEGKEGDGEKKIKI